MVTAWVEVVDARGQVVREKHAQFCNGSTIITLTLILKTRVCT